MQVEIWSDVLCPWCGIGARRLTEALRRDGRDTDVVRHSYQLDPSAPRETTRPVAEAVAIKYGLGPDEVAAMTQRVEEIAATDGLHPYRVGSNVTGSTQGVHELLALAADHGCADVGWERAYRAYFGGTGDIFTTAGLVDLGRDIGLDPAEVTAALADGRYAPQVAADQARADALGVTGVPFVVVDGRYAVPGAQSIDVLRSVLDTAWAEHTAVTAAAGGGRVTDGQAVPNRQERI